MNKAKVPWVTFSPLPEKQQCFFLVDLPEGSAFHPCFLTVVLHFDPSLGVRPDFVLLDPEDYEWCFVC